MRNEGAGAHGREWRAEEEGGGGKERSEEGDKGCGVVWCGAARRGAAEKNNLGKKKKWEGGVLEDVCEHKKGQKSFFLT